MKRRTMIIAVSMLGLGCADKPARDAGPTAPDAAPVSATVGRGAQSTICLSYQAEKARLASAVEKSPTDKRLASQLAAVESMVKDACG